ncbi:MAG: DNA-3-methyladenine glycosylase I [Bacteroidia bacterium]
MKKQEGIIRCSWCLKDDLYMDYHDNEWGKPSYDDRHLFEMLVLESFQAGLSWYTILAKRENFREAFNQFDPELISKYGENKVEELMQNAGIIRNRLKILATINNAKVFLRLQNEYGQFSKYIWKFTDYKVIDRNPKTMKDVPAITVISDEMSKDMKKQGFKFMGSTVCYANMQSIGMVNDHITIVFAENKTK